MKKIKTKFITAYILLNILLLFSRIDAQEDYLYENLTVADGLSSSRVNIVETIYQDRFGFMWFGTLDGLNRYDGYSFKVYKNIPGDTNSLPSSNIQLIREDGEGNLWIGTPGMMSLFNRKKDIFKSYPIASAGNAVQGIQLGRSLVDSKNNFWITSFGGSVQKWDKDLKRFDLIPFLRKVPGVDTLVKSEVEPAIGFTQLRNGNILASSFNGGIFFFNESNNAFEEYRIAGNYQPQGIVEIFEDQSGRIWLGGRNTLAVYNPITFSVEVLEDWRDYSTTKQDVFFISLTETNDDAIFIVGVPFGLAKYYPGRNKFEKIEILGDLGRRGIGKFPTSMFQDKFGVKWIGLTDNGILKFDPNRRPFRFYPFDADNVNQASLSYASYLKTNPQRPGEVFVATNRNGILKFNLQDRKLINMEIPIPSLYTDTSNLSNLALDDDGRIWFSSSSRKISYYDLSSGIIGSFDVADERSRAAQGERINYIEYLPKDQLIVSTSNGAKIFDIESKSFKDLPTVGNRIYDEKLLDYVRDIIDTRESLASHIQVGEAANLSESFSLAEESDLMVVCLGEGIYPNGMFDYGKILDESGSVIWSMDSLANTFHHGGGYKNRLGIETIKLKPGKYELRYNTDIGHSYANFNVPPPHDSSWYGIQLYKLSQSQAGDLSGLIRDELRRKSYPDIFFTDLVISSRKYPNTIWIGSGNKGIIKYDLSSGKYEQYPIEELKNTAVNFSHFFEDSKGILWIVVSPSGFYRFDPERKEFISNASIPEVPLTAINSLVEDFQGNLWISSSGGITKLIKSKDSKGWTITNFDSKDGVPGGFGSGSMITRSGEILFGSFNGIVAFYPSSENTSPPIPIISDINISDISVFDPGSSDLLGKSIFEESELSLSYSQNDISFELASLHYSRPAKNRVSYKLEGFNNDWIFTDKNFASFTNLDPGEYNFRVRAFSGYGIQSRDERTLKIFVSPPWYRTTFAYIAYGLLFVGLIFGIDRFQRRRLLTKERERQRIQEAELRAIAAEAQTRAIEAENERKTRELEEARELQLSMLPKKLPQLPNLDIAVYMKTATEVGGDYYDFHVSMDGALTVVIGDATGHGLRAGTMVTAAKSLFSTHAANPDILFTFSEISRCIKRMDMHMLTMCMTVMKIRQDKMILSSAGMPPTLLFRNANKQLEEISLKGMPLGAVDSFPYMTKETELHSGDTIFLMSDGFPELFNADKEMYGYERVQTDFHKVADRSPEEIIERLKISAMDWSGDQDPNDDVTFVVIKVK